jgi:hypothetical protein
MNKIKLITALGISLLTTMTAFADYTVMYPIKDIPINKISPESPLIGEWINKGSATGCSVWTPAVNTVKKDQSFVQSSDCTQSQTRKIEERIRYSNGSIKLTGKFTTEDREHPVTVEQSAIGTKVTVKECSYSTSFGGGYWLQRNANTMYISWSGSSKQPKSFNSGDLPTQDSYVRDGFTYTKGEFKKIGNGSPYHYVCIE